jgi:Flp pilus assembly pilin Flp
MDRIVKQFKRLMTEEDGPTATEYAVMLGIISAGVIGAMSTFGDGVHAIYLAIDDATDIAAVDGDAGPAGQ